MKIVLSGGGTGGHITPLLAVAHELSSHELHYIGEGSEQEKRLLTQGNMALHVVLAGKFRRYHGETFLSHLKDIRLVVLNIRDAFKFGFGLIQSFYLLLKIRPDVVFSKGGYVALPVGLAAAALRIPLVTHDSDMAPGLTNRVLNKFSAANACGFPRQGSIFTGTPVRASILEAKPLSIKTSKPIVLFVGGSSGALTLNISVAAALEELRHRYYIIHITGDKHFQAAPKGLPGYEPHAFMGDEIGGAIKAADVVVSRAGATAISELAALSKASILVPGAHLTGGQQIKNSQALSHKKAAIVLTDDKLDPQTLLVSIEEALNNKDKYQKAIAEFYQPDAAQKLANLIVQKGGE